MRNRAQILVSILLVVAASTTVVLYARSGGSQSDAGADTEGHQQHGAAAGGDGLNPVKLDADMGRRIGITYATAELRPLDRTLRSVGMVAYDETMVGGMVSATILTLLVVPACYSLLKEWSLKREEARAVAGLKVLEPEPTGAD